MNNLAPPTFWIGESRLPYWIAMPKHLMFLNRSVRRYVSSRSQRVTASFADLTMIINRDRTAILKT